MRKPNIIKCFSACGGVERRHELKHMLALTVDTGIDAAIATVAIDWF